MNLEGPFWQVLLGASPVVQSVLAILLLVSLSSWWVIFSYPGRSADQPL